VVLILLWEIIKVDLAKQPNYKFDENSLKILDHKGYKLNMSDKNSITLDKIDEERVEMAIENQKN